MRRYLATIAVCLASIPSSVAGGQAPPATTPWQLQTSATKAGLRGIHAVGNGVAWASGTNGTILRTEDGGSRWQSCALPPQTDKVDPEKLDFRGIWAWDANSAIAMSSGPGDLSRLYKTTDGCSSWKLLFTNPDKEGFWDAVQFWDKDHGLILGDPVKDSAQHAESKRSTHFVLLQTNDGGHGWKRMWPNHRGVLPGEGLKGGGAFAASNSSATIHSPWAWFGVGSQGGSLIYVGHQVYGDDQRVDGTLENMGFVWITSIPVPISSGTDSAGVFSLAFRDEALVPYDNMIAKGDKNWLMPANGIAVGGDYKKPNESIGTAAYTTDGGKTWTAAAKSPHGYRSAVAWDEKDKVWITVGPNGSDVSCDDGKTWQPLDHGNWNALSLPWVVGPEGRIAKLVSLNPVKVSQEGTVQK